MRIAPQGPDPRRHSVHLRRVASGRGQAGPNSPQRAELSHCRTPPQEPADRGLGLASLLSWAGFFWHHFQGRVAEKA